MPGLHPGNYFTSSSWSDKVWKNKFDTFNQTYEDFFNSIEDFLKDYFKTKGINPNRINVIKGELEKENQNAQFYQYDNN